jgi:hypothetical protein
LVVSNERVTRNIEVEYLQRGRVFYNVTEEEPDNADERREERERERERERENTHGDETGRKDCTNAVRQKNDESP